jgi:hypothetical protein
LRLGHVLAVAVGAVADDLGMDRRAARQGVLEVFQHQRAGTLADHQAVARSASNGRGVVSGASLSRAGGEQGVEHRGLR